jgi:hypothetical protein
VGSRSDNAYSEAPGVTRIRTRGDLKISVLPQKSIIRRVFTTIENEDLAYARC